MKNKIALITGSSRGIGLAIAEEFLRCGLKVVLNCRESVRQMNQAANYLKNISPHVLCIQADVSSYNECEYMFNKITDTYGGIDVLVNNAGVSYIGLLQQMGADEINNIINTNLTGAIYCSKFAAVDMVKRGGGTILNISSIWGGAGASCESAYSASKGGLNAFTKALAKELGPSGIRINAIACGVIETQMNDWISEEEHTALIGQIPLNRFGKPDEIAKLAYFLVSPGSSYITGQIINADGGMF